MKAIFKFVKFVVIALVVIVVLALAAVLSLPCWVGKVVPPVANSIVPQKTGTAFVMQGFALNPYKGTMSVTGIRLDNPADFKQRMAFTLGELSVDVDVASALSDTIVIRDITIRNVFAAYVSNDRGENNFKVIAKNVKGEEPAKAEGEAKATEKPKKRVIIDHLLIEGATIQIGVLPIPFHIELKNIGRQAGGIDWADAWNQISAQVLEQLMKLNTNIKDLGKLLNSQSLKTLDAVKDLTEKPTEALKSVTGKTTETATKAVEKTTETATKAVDKVSEGANKVKEGATKAVDKATEGASKAVDALKSLF